MTFVTPTRRVSGRNSKPAKPCRGCGSKPASCGCCDCRPGSCGSPACDPLAWPCTDAFPGGLSRTRFFDGMRLTQADLENEQRFWRMKRRMTNRAMGQGVVWGLRLDHQPARRTFRLAPGYALDCCGNDLIVEAAREVSERQLVDTTSPTVREILRLAGPSGLVKAQLALLYAEHPEDPRVVHPTGCAPDPRSCEAARVRETARLCLVPWVDPCAPEHDPCAPRVRPRKKPAAAAAEAAAEEALPEEVPLRFGVGVSFGGDRVELEPRPTGDGGEWGWSAKQSGLNMSMDAALQLDVWLGSSTEWLFVAPPRVTSVEDGSLFEPPPVSPSTDPMEPALREAYGWTNLYTPAPQATPPGFEPPQRTYDVTGELESDRTGQRISLQGYLTFRTVDVTLENGVMGFGLSITGQFETMAQTGSCLDPLRDAFRSECPPCGDPGDLVKGLVAALAPAFGTHLAAEPGELAELLACWCREMLYPGPRCRTDHHGVVLGTIVLDGHGRIHGWEPWEGRRHVLTGPLVEHWLGSVGVAPPDTMVSALAQVICCVAGQQKGEPSAAPPPVGGPRKGQQAWFDRASGAGLVMGEESAVKELVQTRKAKIHAGGARSGMAAVSAMIGALSQPKPAGAPERYIHYRLGGLGQELHLLVPDGGAVADAEEAGTDRAVVERGFVESAMGRADAKPGAVGEAAFRELVTELAARTPLPLDERYDAPARALLGHGVRHLGAALTLGPERLFERVASADEAAANVGEVNALWDASAAQVDELVERTWKVAASAAEGGFSRRTLADGAFGEALVKELGKKKKGSGLKVDAAAVREALVAAAGRKKATE